MPGPGVRADDGAERRRDLDLRARAHPRDELLERSQPFGRGGVRDADPQRRRVRRARLEQRAELGERLLAAAHALQRHDLAVADRQDRLDVEQAAGERRRAADAPAAGEVLERVDREQQLVLALEALDERVDLLVGRPALEPALDREARASRSRPRRSACRSRAPRRRQSAAAAVALANVPESVDESWSERTRSYAARAPRRPRRSRRASAATSSAARPRAASRA